MQTAATWGVVGSPGSGAIALAHIDRTLPSVSAPSSVVRSIMLIAVSMAQALDVVLMERVPNPAARASAPTWSTPGSPCSHLVTEAFVRAPTPSSSRALDVAVRALAVAARARAVAGGEVTDGVYPPMIGSWDVTERHDASLRNWSERHVTDETARTLMSGKTSTKHLIRQRSPLADQVLRRGLAAHQCPCGLVSYVAL